MRDSDTPNDEKAFRYGTPLINARAQPPEGQTGARGEGGGGVLLPPLPPLPSRPLPLIPSLPDLCLNPCPVEHMVSYLMPVTPNMGTPKFSPLDLDMAFAEPTHQVGRGRG